MNGDSIIGQLAFSLKRRDEQPNIDLAKHIAKTNNTIAVKELIAQLGLKNKDIAHDCIKVLYEIAAIQPKLISNYLPEFVAHLNHKNNRIQWGAMSAIDYIALEIPDKVYNFLPQILEAANKGSVITKDHAVGILVKLCSLEKYQKNVFALLMEQLQKSEVNQLPMYAEQTMTIADKNNKDQFAKILQLRLADVEKESKRKRIEKVLKKLEKI
jgi:hypothetical protein